MRTESLQIKMDKGFKALIFDRAALYGLNASEYIRHLVLNDIKKDALME